MALTALYNRANTRRPIDWNVWLVLGRVSNLPTVWTNCVAGWLLSGGGPWYRLLLLCLGGTCLYIGGMFLNDAFDAEFDRQYRKERPIPSGRIGSRAVWQAGAGCLAFGALLLSILGKVAAMVALILIGFIVLYDAVHKRVSFSPVMMGACRFLLYLLAGAAASEPVRGLTVWSGLALTAYIIGLSYVARKESTRGLIKGWPLYLLGVPILLCLLVNGGEHRTEGIVLSLVLGLWILRCIRFIWWTAEPDPGKGVAGLLAGIVLVDLAATGAGSGVLITFFVVSFVLTLFLQRFVPAT